MDKVVVRDFCTAGECSRCGACCSNYLPMTKKEIKTMKRWVKRHHFAPQAVKDVLDVTCPFLDKVNLACACYEIRPECCRKFLCHTANNGGYKIDGGGKYHTIVNLRKDIFGDQNTIPYADFQVLMEYIRSNPKSSMEIKGVE